MKNSIFTPYNRETWPRSSHFDYYTKGFVKSVNSMTVRLDVSHFREKIKEKGLRFFPAFIALTGQVIAQSRELCTNVDETGAPGSYAYLHPNFTIFHKDDHTFSDLWSLYDGDFDTFYGNILADLAAYGDKKGIKIKEDQPKNFFCISCVPWLSYEAYTPVNYGGSPNLFPIITCGKFTPVHGRLLMPFTLTISHASADGYHLSQFFLAMQEALDRF